MPHNVDSTPPGGPAAWYESKRTMATHALHQAERRARYLSWARLAVAAAIVASVAAAYQRGTTFAQAIAIVVTGAFVGLIVLHGRARAAVSRARDVIAASSAGLARIARAWEQLPPPRVTDAAPDEQRATARDLDVLGPTSLMRLLDVCTPALGGKRVLRWLLTDPPPRDAIDARQRTVRALRDRPDLLLDVAGIARHAAGRSSSIERLVAWCTGDGLPNVRIPAMVAMCTTAIVIGTIAYLAIDPSSTVATRLLSLLAIVHVTLAVRARRVLNRSLRGVDDILTQIRNSERVLRRLTAEPSVDGELAAIQGRLRDEAAPALHDLAGLVAWNEMHRSPLPHFLMNVVLAFDVHLAAAVGRWRERHAARTPEWLSLLADAEALIALGTLAHDNPQWTFPTVHDDDAAPFAAAEGCAHPLLPPSSVVANALRLDRRGEGLIVSGSNMSGKTTYLRALGLNALLAMAGGPVCAAAFTVRRCRVRTSVRVEDDLGRGVSLFLAEVTRLRDIVREAEAADSAPVLFLLDEILHGTNAVDRRQATQMVLSRLIDAGASGIVTTHDPSIADALGETAHHAHFEEQIERRDGAPVMRFDYRVRSGPATSANALLILKMMGIGER